MSTRTMRAVRPAVAAAPISRGLAFDPDLHKIAVPSLGHGVVARTSLVERFLASDARFVVVIAPAGYGKTTVLAQWARRDPRPVVWIGADEGDDDPAVLLGYLALALDRIRPLPQEVFASLRSRRTPVVRAAVPRIIGALHDMDTPVLMVVDDVHVLSDPESVDAIALIAERLPQGSQLAIAAREEPALPLARMRAERELLEVPLEDLALSVPEVARLVSATGVEVSDEDAAILASRTEGWPAAVYLAALSLRKRSDVHEAVEHFGGSDRWIVDYVRDELLGPLAPPTVRFLTRTAVLRRMSGPLCDAVLQSRGSATRLEDLERSNRLVIPLDRQRRWYRYQALFREMLLTELRSREPEIEVELHRRAADWFEAKGRVGDAVDHAHGAGDPDRAGRCVAQVALPFMQEGRVGTVRRWLERFDERAIADFPPLTLAAAWAHAFSADPRALRWLEVAERASFDGALPDGTASLESGVAFLRAVLCTHGLDAMIGDAATALDLELPGSSLRASAMVLLGTGLTLTGLVDAGVTMLREVIELEDLVRTQVRVIALTELAIAEANRALWVEATSYVDRCRGLVDEDRLYDVAPFATFAISALVAAHGGDVDRAVAELELARRLRGETTYVIPWLALQGHLCAAHASLALADPRAADAALRDSRSILQRRPRLGSLVEQVDRLDATLRRWSAERLLGPETLTPAELRLLPLLPTHLSFRQIGEHLYVSTNTVKTQVMSMYRKLRVSTRAEAVQRAEALGLLASLPAGV